MEQVKLKDLKGSVISGIYCIKYPNGKVYVGQSQNIYKRVMEHNQRSRHDRSDKKIQVCEKAIQKYGEVEEFIILERVNDLSLLDKAETYWIKFYDSTNPDKGYNLLEGKDISQQKGVTHTNAVFTQKQLDEIVDLLQNHNELSLIDIANKYGVVQDTILRISTGKTYVNPSLSYPLRKNNHASQRKDKWEDYFESMDQLLALKEDLKYSWWLRMDNGDLYKKYHITRKLLYAINKGEKFGDIGNYDYPIRTKTSRISFTKEQIEQILLTLRNTSLSMTEIGQQFQVYRGTIAKINKGESYPIKGYDYPAR